MPPTLGFRKEEPTGMLATWKTDLIAAGFEFLGTITFLLLGLGPIQAVTYVNNSYPSGGSPDTTGSATSSLSVDQLMYFSAGLGLALLVSAWLFFRVSGALFNPNVGTALMLVGAITPLRWLFFCVAQMIGAIVAAALLHGLMPGPLAVNTTLGPGVNRVQGVFIEMFMTAFLCFAVLMLAVEKHKATPFAPLGVGLTLFACELWGVGLTGGSLNTARSFGPAVIAGFTNAHWIYWVGPELGAFLAAGVYMLVKRSKYWTLAPDQDTQDTRQSPPDPTEKV